jgi:hypothetical protein
MQWPLISLRSSSKSTRCTGNVPTLPTHKQELVGTVTDRKHADAMEIAMKYLINLAAYIPLLTKTPTCGTSEYPYIIMVSMSQQNGASNDARA